jgi:dephospho-CoA kinase
MKVIGVTGGIGMGKSTAASLLAERCVAVTDTDQIARDQTAPGTEALREIQAVFGPDIVADDGTLRREQLAEIVFRDEAARKILEGILHPRIAAAWRKQLTDWRDGGCARAAVIIPLLFERDYAAEFDATVCVACSSGTQRERLRQRGWTDEQIQARNSAQLPVEEKLNRSRFVVWTEGRLEVHARQWDRILAAL